MDFLTKRRLTNLAMIVLVILNLFTLTMLWFHQLRERLFPPPPPPDTEGPGRVEHFLERELDLTKEQVERFDELRKQHFLRSEAIMEEIHQLKREITEQLFLSSPDTGKVGRLTEEIGSRQAQLERLLFKHFTDLKSACQPEQKRKFETLIHDLMEVIEPRHAPCPPGNR
jgi:Spy/CpxP family protein refolding chaperone